MLQTLKVKNFAIVENARVDFNAGLNIITGETGAGKSILTGALGLVLGERADKSMIRAGEDKCGVEAVFHLSDSSDIDSILDELGLDPCDDGNLVIRRIVSNTGSGKNLLNDSAVTVQALKQIGDCLVDMHGPHDHQSLLHQDQQIDLLDAYGHLWNYRTAYEEAYDKSLSLISKLRELDSDEDETASQIDLLSFQIKEIEDADLSEKDDNLEEEHTLTANSNRIIELTNTAQDAIMESDTSAFSAIVAAQGSFTELSRLCNEASEWKEEAKSINIQIQELSDSISRFAQEIETNNDRLQWLEDRLALLQRLKRKYGGSIQVVKEHLEKAKERLADLETRHEQIAQVEEELEQAKKKVREQGNILSEARSKTAAELSVAITSELKDLGFPHGEFNVNIEQSEPVRSGMDNIDFGFAPNVGEPQRPLRIIASSGEISRVMLAIKAILALHDRIPILVFDEIDTNVGGEMGRAIGRKLTKIAANHQVLCITHLAQVAAKGNCHFSVFKKVENGRTYSCINPLSEQERINEIARMLGGEPTDTAIKHAEEMLNKGG